MAVTAIEPIAGTVTRTAGAGSTIQEVVMAAAVAVESKTLAVESAREALERTQGTESIDQVAMTVAMAVKPETGNALAVAALSSQAAESSSQAAAAAAPAPPTKSLALTTVSDCASEDTLARRSY